MSRLLGIRIGCALIALGSWLLDRVDPITMPDEDQLARMRRRLIEELRENDCADSRCLW